MRQQVLPIIRYGQVFIQNSQTNGFSSFYADDYVTCDAQSGNITAMKQITDLLKVIQQTRVTSWGIDKKWLKNSDGSDTAVTATDIVLNKVRPNEEFWGTSDPTSVVLTDKHLYYFSWARGEFIRNSYNGQISISHEPSVKMSMFFNKVKQQIDTATAGYQVLSTYSNKFHCLITTINIYNYPNPRPINPVSILTNTYTLMFHDLEGSNRWITNLNFTDSNGTPPEMYASLDNTMIAFIGGQIYKLFSDTENYGKFFGVQYSEIVTVVANKEKEKVKVLNALGLTTNLNNPKDPNGWQVEITTPANVLNPTGMLTHIIPQNFQQREEMSIYSDVPKNENTKMIGNALYKRFNGEDIRGDCALIQLSNNSSQSVVLYSVIIKSTPSERSGAN
jgi:hypothetical protein